MVTIRKYSGKTQLHRHSVTNEEINYITTQIESLTSTDIEDEFLSKTQYVIYNGGRKSLLIRNSDKVNNEVLYLRRNNKDFDDLSKEMPPKKESLSFGLSTWAACEKMEREPFVRGETSQSKKIREPRSLQRKA